MPEDQILDRVFECARVAADKRGEDIRLLKLEGMTSYTDYFLLVSASSDRRVKNIADGVRERMKELGMLPLSMEGHREGQWVLMDYGDWVVHVFYEELRSVFDLEGLWSDAPRVEIPEEILRTENAEMTE